MFRQFDICIRHYALHISNGSSQDLITALETTYKKFKSILKNIDCNYNDYNTPPLDIGEIYREFFKEHNFYLLAEKMVECEKKNQGSAAKRLLRNILVSLVSMYEYTIIGAQ
jgi:hypothetical protein